jgi:hypothetical protein
MNKLGQSIGKEVPAGHRVFSGHGTGGFVLPSQKLPGHISNNKNKNNNNNNNNSNNNNNNNNNNNSTTNNNNNNNKIKIITTLHINKNKMRKDTSRTLHWLFQLDSIAVISRRADEKIRQTTFVTCFIRM